MWDSKRDTDVKNRLLDSVGEGKGGMIWEDSIETCILPYVKQITSHQSKFDAWNRALKAGALGQPRGMGWGGTEEGDSGWGTHVHLWLIHVNVWQKPPQYCKVISFQLKQTNKQTNKNTRVGSYSLSRGSSQSRDWTWVSCIADRFFTIWTTREAPLGL